jgi:CheY-like chemotaxis protein
VANALTVVVGWLERAQQAPLDGEARRALDIALARATDGRSIARRAIGHPSPTVSLPQPLGALLDEALAGASVELSSRRSLAQLPAVLIDGDPTALLDEPRAALQILTNLLLNAIAFSPPGGRVQLSARVAWGEVEIEVHDEGPGLPQAAQQAYFPRGHSTREGGTGLGLAHAQALARRLGGELTLQPAGPGATFVLRGPRARGPLPDAPPVSRPVLLAGQRILLLEDDAAVQALLDAALGARGALVRIVEDLPGLVAALASSPYDIALLDWSPLAGQATETIRHLQASSPHIRIVAISGAASSPSDELLSSCAAWVRKPFDLGELLAAITPTNKGA